MNELVIIYSDDPMKESHLFGSGVIPFQIALADIGVTSCKKDKGLATRAVSFA